MVTQITVYVEGGGPDRNLQARLREALAEFLSEPRNRARDKRVRFRTVACGPRWKAGEDFLRAVRRREEGVLNLLLVDAEGPVTTKPWLHLRDHTHSPMPLLSPQLAGNCHLMVQAMEAWLIVDRENLCRYYGSGLNPGALPAHREIERVDRSELLEALEAATRHTRKGPYSKGKHSFDLLKGTDPHLAQEASPHCRRLSETLQQALGDGRD